MKLSKAQAKKIGIEVWGYLAKHGEIQNKIDLPERLFRKIEDKTNCCPCCAYLAKKYPGPNGSTTKEECEKCPLNIKGSYRKNYCGCKDYIKWSDAKTNKARAKYAAIIRDKIKEW